MEWVARITAVALEMVLPGIVGHYLDRRWGTSFLSLCGFIAGATFGLWQLIRWSQEADRKGPGGDRQDPQA
jgi:hypothetical protein